MRLWEKMEILLTDDVVGLGDIGETVNVKPGYARNYLIPRGMAVESGAKNAKMVAHKMNQITAKKKRLQAEAQQEAQKLQDVEVEIGMRVGSGGKVFGSVNARQIADALAEKGIEIDRRRILLSEPIKKLGVKEVRVKLHSDVVATIKVSVTSIAATADEELQETLAAQVAMEAAAEQRRRQGDSDEEGSEEDFDAEDELSDEEDEEV